MPTGYPIIESTWESLESILQGLDLQPEDTVLAIGGSGDQAFAMLEYGAKITVSDYDPLQIEFIRKRIQQLSEKDYESFAKFNPYFTPERCERIRSNLGNLEIRNPSNIFEIATTESGFNKIYLSNSVNYEAILDPGLLKGTEILQETFSRIAKQLPSRGLIYLDTWGRRESHWVLVGGSPLSYVPRLLRGFARLSGKYVDDFKVLKNIGLTINERLTSIARSYHMGSGAIIYQKID